ncbi:unnamed protein product [Onchocerca flexuosa]|uniref:ACT domain-containing protein n=1 Tax=Onchocerca flexuosa TaxID=387005 RepID=A0A183HU63_9BILA|nr:unnamed protein product [Onchocerca flexuosa]
MFMLHRSYAYTVIIQFYYPKQNHSSLLLIVLSCWSCPQYCKIFCCIYHKIISQVNGKQSPLTRHDKRRHMSMKELIAEQKNAVVAPHPIHIEMEIACQDDIYVTLVLQFIPGLRSVGVMAKLNRVPTSIYGNALFDISLLAELFDGDDGSKCINSAGQAKLDQLEYAFK